jgi:hypothetical protein
VAAELRLYAKIENMSQKKVLFVLTNVSKVPDTDKAIGWWLVSDPHVMV